MSATGTPEPAPIVPQTIFSMTTKYFSAFSSNTMILYVYGILTLYRYYFWRLCVAGRRQV